MQCLRFNYESSLTPQGSTLALSLGACAQRLVAPGDHPPCREVEAVATVHVVVCQVSLSVPTDLQASPGQGQRRHEVRQPGRRGCLSPQSSCDCGAAGAARARPAWDPSCPAPTTSTAALQVLRRTLGPRRSTRPALTRTISSSIASRAAQGTRALRSQGHQREGSRPAASSGPGVDREASQTTADHHSSWEEASCRGEAGWACTGPGGRCAWGF